jgi:F-type H+-transporting ATPase subunit delta
MKERIIARAYAKSIVQLGKEMNVEVAKEITTLTEVINANNNLETVLFLDVFTIKEKISVLQDIMNKLNMNVLTQNFVQFMMKEKRVSLFPLIAKEVIVLDDEEKGFMRGTIEGANVDVDPEFQKQMTEYLAKKVNKKTILEYKQNEKITAGYRVTLEDLQLDATLDNQLNKFKQSVLNS